MNYPEHIYRKYEVVQKEIYGEVYYGLLRVYNIFGWKVKRQVKVSENFWCSTLGSISVLGKRWHESKKTIFSAINADNLVQETRFKEKLTK